jgi:Mrp family chromosome partitioning ATPase
VSKNFELLQEIGGNDGLFQASSHVTSDILNGNGEANPEIDKEARERILQNATLPNVFETAKSGDGRHNQSDLTSLRFNTVDGEIRTSERAAIPSVGPSIQPGQPKSREFHRSSKSTASLAGFSTPTKLVALPDALPKQEREVRRKATKEESGEESSQFQWMRLMKSGVERWNRRLQAPSKPRASETEAIAREEEVKLVQRVFAEKDQESPRVALFAGADGECESAEICARSAEILAARGDGPVCLVDADFQRPSLHQYFGVENEKGLAEATVEAGSIQSFAQQIPEPDLWLLTTGKAYTGNGFSKIADGLRVRIKELRTAFRYVIIHGGALRVEKSAMLMSRWTDGVVLVVEANSTRRDSAKRAKENLQAANVSILGVVLTNRTFPIPEAIYRRL